MWPLIEGPLNTLASQRYAEGTLRLHASRLLAFAAFTARQGVSDAGQLPHWLGPFVDRAGARPSYRTKLRSLLGRFIRHLQRTGVIPCPPPPPPSPGDVLVEAYLQSLREQRGLAPRTLELRRRLCRSVLTFLADEGISDLRDLRPDLVHGFVAWQAKRYDRHALRGACSGPRDLLSFLHRRGALAADLAGAVVSPRVYQHEQCPRFLTRREVEAVLAAVGRDTPLGRRDYAMLLLLAVYGLRGGEVVRLRLDDVDWRGQLLHVRARKGGHSTTYPLSAAVGEAVVAYLRDGRPASPHREVFLAAQAPFGPLADYGALACRVKRYLAAAGVRVARPGAHSFRYSCAQRLFEQGLPLKSIGDYLGHRHPGTTRRYTAVALEQLREVALGDGEDLL